MIADRSAVSPMKPNVTLPTPLRAALAAAALVAASGDGKEAA